MNSVDVRDFRCADDPVDLKVTIGARGLADTYSFIGQLHMERVYVGLGVDSYGGDPEFFAGANDPEGDLTPVRNQNFAKHNYFTRNRDWPNCTGVPFSTRISRMDPLTSALISFITFIASMMHTTVSSVTSCPTSTNGAESGEGAR